MTIKRKVQTGLAFSDNKDTLILGHPADSFFCMDTFKAPASNKFLFVIPPEVIDAMTDEEVTATVRGLQEMNMYRLPYDKVDIRLKADNVLRPSNPDDYMFQKWLKENGHSAMEPFGPEAEITFYDITTQENAPIRIFLHWLRNKHWWGKLQLDAKYWDEYAKKPRPKDASISEEALRKKVCDMLIVLLATRNVVKRTTEDKLAKVGIGANKGRHRYTTSISLPREMEDHPDKPPKPGVEKCPHLRRGHKREQRYGPGLKFVKPIWIEPVMVNADKEWTKTREAYNLSFGVPKRPKPG